MVKRNLILGIGNPILGDDSVGIRAVRELGKRLSSKLECTDFRENSTCTIDLIDELQGYDRVIIIDSIENSGKKPGTCIELKLDDIKNSVNDRFISNHGLNLPALWEFGKKLGLHLPEEMLLLGIAVGDCSNFSEDLSKELRMVFHDVVSLVAEKILKWLPVPIAPKTIIG